MLGLLLALLLYSAPEGAAAADGADAITFVLEEVPRSGGSSPRMRFSFQTVGILSCHRLQAAFRKSGDVLRLGPISRESFSPCPPTVVPAAGSREVDLEPGRYELHVLNNGADDLFEVEISDFLIRTRALRPPAASAVAIRWCCGCWRIRSRSAAAG
jgi:hypothetical protein